MALSPKEYGQLKAFRDLVKSTIDTLDGATSQGLLSQAVSDLAPRWKTTDPAFAQVLEGVGSSVWSMPFQKVRPTVQKIVGHLGGQLADIEDELRNG